jgi:hypothetical protein
MIKAILNNWSVMRGLRLVMGVIALVQSVIQKDIPLGVIAGFLLLTVIANIRCCGSKGCAVNYSNRKKKVR